jgi:hypothetical protein
MILMENGGPSANNLDQLGKYKSNKRAMGEYFLPASRCFT